MPLSVQYTMITTTQNIGYSCAKRAWESRPTRIYYYYIIILFHATRFHIIILLYYYNLIINCTHRVYEKISVIFLTVHSNRADGVTPYASHIRIITCVCYIRDRSIIPTAPIKCNIVLYCLGWHGDNPMFFSKSEMCIMCKVGMV